MVAARVDGNADAANVAKATATALLDAALAR
jgi:hypothetical protein